MSAAHARLVGRSACAGSPRHPATPCVRSAVNDNALFYSRNMIPFVMGTTGGDRDKLYRDVHASGNYAVIAPQMGKQIVAFQAMMGEALLGKPHAAQDALWMDGWMVQTGWSWMRRRDDG